MMGNRPTIHHDHADHDLPVAGFAITAVAESPQLRRSGSFKEGGGYVIEHQVRAQAEQIPQFQEDLLRCALFVRADHPDFDTKVATVQSPPSPGGIASTPASSDCPQHCTRNSLPAIAPARAHCQDE